MFSKGYGVFGSASRGRFTMRFTLSRSVLVLFRSGLKKVALSIALHDNWFVARIGNDSAGKVMASKTASIQYRYVKLDGLWPGFHLKNMVVDVLRRAAPGGDVPLGTLARLRKKDLDQDGSYVLLNKLSDAGSWDGAVFCGQIIHVKSGAQLPGINGTLEDDTPEFELQNLTFEQLTQIVEGVLYFVLVGNHVGMIEGQRTRGRTLERYLTRILQDAGELEAGKPLILNTKLVGSIQEVNRVEITPARAHRGDVVENGQAGGPVVARDAAREEGKGTTVLEILKLLGWKEEQVDNLLQQVPEGGWIEGTLTVLFKNRGRRAAKISRAQLEEALRDLDSRSVGLLGDGAREKGGLIKLTERCSIECEGDLLDPSAAMAQIVQAMRKWSDAGKIDCTFE
jgi:hypothetical protein